MQFAPHLKPYSSRRSKLLSAMCLMTLAPHLAGAADITDTAYGTDALSSITTGTGDSAFGYSALKANTTGSSNTAMGNWALKANTTGSVNTAIGSGALQTNTSGGFNTAAGASALGNNTTGTYNTATGMNALLSNTTGANNVAMGMGALNMNTDGLLNTAVGSGALYGNTSGDGNIATGVDALRANTLGNYNTALGTQALRYNDNGSWNTAIGSASLYSNTTGIDNTAFGSNALYSNVTGHDNIALGYQAGRNALGSYNIYVGHVGAFADDRIIRIGTPAAQTRTYVAGISGTVIGAGVQVLINSSGQLGTLTSSQRFKKEIKSIDATSSKLLQLRPVSFVYKDDNTNQMQYGLIAEEVAKVYPDLVQLDEEGKPFTVYYHLLTPLLLSELQKQHAVVEVQQEQLAALKQERSTERAEMLSLIQQQQQQMAAMQKQLTQLDTAMQANQLHATEKVALRVSP